MEIIKYANIGLRFVLELCVLCSLGYWGFQTGRGIVVKIGLGIGAPLLAALVWGMFGAPGSRIQVSGALHLLLELVIFGVAVVALKAAGHLTLAWAFGLVVVVNRVLMYVWGQ
jgi:hypothetical protein